MYLTGFFCYQIILIWQWEFRKIMSETEVSEKVTGVTGTEEQCGSGTSCSQDPPEPDLNKINQNDQVNGPDNSHALAIVGDGLCHNGVEKKAVVIEGLSVLPESMAAVDDQGAELDAQNEKLDAVTREGSSFKTPEPAAAFEDQGADLDARNDKLDAVTGDGSSVPPESMVAIEVQVADLDAVTGVDSSVPPKSMTSFVDQGAELDAQIEKFDEINGEVGDSLDEKENGNVEFSNGGHPVGSNSSWELHRSLANGDQVQASVCESLEEYNGKTEGGPEAEVKQAEDPSGKIKSSTEAATKMVCDQDEKIEGVAMAEHEKVGVPVRLESSTPKENQESQFGALELVAESRENGVLSDKSSNIKHTSANDECVDRTELSAFRTSDACHGSGHTVVDVVDCKLQDVSMEGGDEVKLMTEVMQNVEHKVPLATSFNSNNKNWETLEDEAKTTMDLNVIENQKRSPALAETVQGMPNQIDEAKYMVSCSDVEDVCDLVLEDTNKVDFFVSQVEDDAQYPKEAGKNNDDSGVSRETMNSEEKTNSSLPTQSLLASNTHETLTEDDAVEADSSPNNGPKFQTIEKELPINQANESVPDMADLVKKDQAFKDCAVQAENEISSGKDKVRPSLPSPFDATLKPGVRVHNLSTISIGQMTCDVPATCKNEVSASFDVNDEGASDVLRTKVVEDKTYQFDGAERSSDDNSFLQNEEAGNPGAEISAASPEGSSGNVIDIGEGSTEAIRKPFNFLIRIARCDDDSLREKIRLAKLHVDEKTKLRDVIQVQIQKIRQANNQIHGLDYEYAKIEGRSARKLVSKKRMEIDSFQFMINKAKNALAIKDIDNRLYSMEHMIQHETLPLKEEKQLIREMKQLKLLREELASNLGSQDEIKQALEQREELEERSRILRKELEILKDRALKAEAAAVRAERNYDDENKKVKELQAQFRAANEVRQAAYAQWQSLRKELSKKNKFFFKYKDDAAVASNYAFRRDNRAVHRLCTNQVEKFMELWNASVEFRREYVQFNTRSTVRRFGTLDGRSLGPNEESYVLLSLVPEAVDKIVLTPTKNDSVSQIRSLEIDQETSVEVPSGDKSMKKATEQKAHKVANKKPTEPALENGLDAASGGEVIDKAYDEPEKSGEDIELITKDEELRMKEAEANLKEQCRLEMLAKANEARERKKRQAEKLHMRAELKTQKEAEQREKEREKRLRKKERKKAAAADANDHNNNCETGSSSESTVEIGKDVEVKDMNSGITKRGPQKPWLFPKSKTKPVPPPLRNRNKKRIQQWMWVALTSITILSLFWLGNMWVSTNVNLKRRNPAY